MYGKDGKSPSAIRYDPHEKPENKRLYTPSGIEEKVAYLVVQDAKDPERRDIYALPEGVLSTEKSKGYDGLEKRVSYELADGQKLYLEQQEGPYDNVYAAFTNDVDAMSDMLVYHLLATHPDYVLMQTPSSMYRGYYEHSVN